MAELATDFDAPPGLFPTGVKAIFTHRSGGVSSGEFATLNLGQHVGDKPSAVLKNRLSLTGLFDLPGNPVWLDQIHSNHVIRVDRRAPAGAQYDQADGAYTRDSGVVLAVMVADCLPIFLCDAAGLEIAVVHAGWRGLASGIIEKSIGLFAGSVTHAWVGPGVGPCHYEIDTPVKRQFGEYPGAFKAGRDRGHWHLDLQEIAQYQLASLGVSSVTVTARCTACFSEDYYSVRRDGSSGRMAGLMWIE